MGVKVYNVKGLDGVTRTIQLNDEDAAKYGKRATLVKATAGPKAKPEDKSAPAADDKSAPAPANKGK